VTALRGGTDYSRGDADRVFKDVFGDNQFIKDFMREFTRTGGRTPVGLYRLNQVDP
jgi:hypothetical protein